MGQKKIRFRSNFFEASALGGAVGQKILGKRRNKFYQKKLDVSEKLDPEVEVRRRHPDGRTKKFKSGF